VLACDRFDFCISVLCKVVFCYMYCVYVCMIHVDVVFACTGFVEVCIMHPLDLIKTRFQIQRGADDPTRYNSMVDCVRKMYRTEG